MCPNTPKIRIRRKVGCSSDRRTTWTSRRRSSG
jgi:hypothetical protein